MATGKKKTAPQTSKDNQPESKETKKDNRSLNEESGIGWQGVAHSAVALGGLAGAFNAVANENAVMAAIFGTVGLFALLTLKSVWFTQRENFATILTFLGQKKGNITGGGLKWKKPWPWRSRYATVPTYIQNEEVSRVSL